MHKNNHRIVPESEEIMNKLVGKIIITIWRRGERQIFDKSSGIRAFH